MENNAGRQRASSTSNCSQLDVPHTPRRSRHSSSTEFVSPPRTPERQRCVVREHDRHARAESPTTPRRRRRQPGVLPQIQLLQPTASSSTPLEAGPSLNSYQIGQHRRRERERAAALQLPPTPVSQPQQRPNNRSLAQQRRREQERARRDGVQHTAPALAIPLPPTPLSQPRQAPRGRPPGQQNRREQGRSQTEQRAGDAASTGRVTGRVSQSPPRNQPVQSRVNREAVRLREVPPARRSYQDPRERHDLGRMDVTCPSCGALHWMAERLATSSNRSPRFGVCCNSGKVDLPLLPDPPQGLKTLLDGDGEQSKDFREQIRQYNAALAFTSLGVEIDRSVLDGHGPYVFRIHGELCHRIDSLLPPEGERPVYAQLYIHDPRVALQERMSQNTNLRTDTMELLQILLSENHQYARAYKHAFEVLESPQKRMKTDSSST